MRLLVGRAGLAVAVLAAAACHLDRLVNAGGPASPIGDPAAAPHLVFTNEPAPTAADSVIHPAVTVTVFDARGHQDTAFTEVVTVTLVRHAGDPADAQLAGTVSAPASGGVATFSELRVTLAGPGYALAASTGAGVVGAVSAPFDVTAEPPARPGPATHLAFIAAPDTAVAGAAMTPAAQVAAEDSSGRAVTGFTGVVTISLGADPAGGTLAGTLSVSAVNGLATFADLSIARAGAGYTLVAAAGGLAAATSAPVVIVAGSATALAFAVQPSNTALLTTIQPPVEVTAYDAEGNLAAGFTGQVHVAIGHDASLLGNATLSGTTTVTAVRGVATFADLSIDQVGSGYTLTAEFAGKSPAAASAAFDVGP